MSTTSILAYEESPDPECDLQAIPIQELEPLAIFGFDGHVASGLKVHPDGVHLLFPLGSKVAILQHQNNKMDFLCGHTNKVSCLNISQSGKYVVSGQINHMGYRAFVIVWDWATRKEILRHELHKVRVESADFTSNEKYVLSLGGRDCGTVVVWNIEKNAPLCGSPSTKETTGYASKIAGLRKHTNCFVTGGDQNLRLWCIDSIKRRLYVHDVSVGKLGRSFTSLQIDANDEIMYAGTMSGDVVKVRLNCPEDLDAVEREKNPVLLGCYGRHNPRKQPEQDCEKYKNGVRDLIILRKGVLVIGAGDGAIELVEERNANFKKYRGPTWPQFRTLKRTRVGGAISTLCLIANDLMLVGTVSCEIYSVRLTDFDLKLLKTCHTSTVYDVAFPYNFSLVFATAGHESIRVWSVAKLQELLRIVVPNFQAASVIFSRDGKSIVSAWNDGVIRAFTPLTGRLIYAIPNAHNKGCSAIAMTSNCKILVSGGIEGQVRVWKIEPYNQSLIGVLKEHYAPIATVDINAYDTEVVSSSSDGSCIIWDLVRLTRRHVLFAHTQFLCARFFPNGVQVLTSGSDKSISYWEVYDGSQVREIEGSKTGPVNCVDLNDTGEYFVSAGEDQVVKLWDYQKGEQLCAGHGHAGVITAARYSPNGKFIVTGSSDGGVFMWRVPEEYHIRLEEGAAGGKKENLTKRSSDTKAKNRPSEHIRNLESRNSAKSVVCECPSVDKEKQPNLGPTVSADDLLETASVVSIKSSSKGV